MNAIEIRNLTKQYPGFTLGPIDLELPSGCILGLIGENGAGKSTTVKLILDMVHRDGGTITILGRDKRENLHLTKEDIDIICAGDLINQCTGSSYGLRQLEIPFMGMYGACSTMAESLIAASLLVDSGAAERTAAVTSSHFSTAERQFRTPLSYGGQRTPTAQWTCTASGAVTVTADKGDIAVYGCCVGKIADMDITDITNMGAAMAPAAMETLCRYFKATNSSPTDFDHIVTGDLGILGSKLLIELMEKQGYDISAVHKDCGEMIFNSDEQDTHCGGSGCGCSASVLCGYFLPMLQRGALKRILFIATGALMSAMSVQQGESIPTIAHLLELRSK